MSSPALRTALAFCLSLSLVVGLTETASAAPPGLPKTVETSGIEFINPRTEQAIRRGLEFLVRVQRPDGSFGTGSNYEGHVAVTALAGLAFLSSGSTPGRGPYGEPLERAVKYVLDNTGPTGLITVPEHRHMNPMYGHGFATLFLAEVYGMTGDPRIKDKLKSAVKLIINSQNKEGGWRYFPVRKEADVSASVCQMMALRAARNAGLSVPKSTVDACVDYVRKCQNPDGGFSYMLNGGGMGTQSLPPRSAAGIVALYTAGVYQDKQIERGLRYLQDQSGQPEQMRQEGFYYYGQYYGAQAMWYAGGDYWRRWYPKARDELLARQNPTGGNWVDMTVCPEYGTAMACIVLQLPNNFLPIFQR